MGNFGNNPLIKSFTVFGHCEKEINYNHNKATKVGSDFSNLLSDWDNLFGTQKSFQNYFCYFYRSFYSSPKTVSLDASNFSHRDALISRGACVAAQRLI